MTERALELLCLPDEPCYLLDLGCGSGLSGECIEEQVTFFHSSHGCYSHMYLDRGMCSIFLFSLNIQLNIISCRVTVGLVWTSRLPCLVLPMRGSWRGTWLVEILERVCHSGRGGKLT